jgi:hypothetical protein
MVMKKDCIGDFVQAWRDWDKTRPLGLAHNWDSRCTDAGYYRVNVSPTTVQHHWIDMHKWCQQQFGKTHYFWSTTNTAWFESEKDAMLFILRWL